MNNSAIASAQFAGLMINLKEPPLPDRFKPASTANYSIGHVRVAALCFHGQLQETNKTNGYMEAIGRYAAPKTLHPAQVKKKQL